MLHPIKSTDRELIKQINQETRRSQSYGKRDNPSYRTVWIEPVLSLSTLKLPTTMYNFVYCFPVGTHIQWSLENDTSLLKQVVQPDKDRVLSFIEDSNPGDYLSLQDGTFIFRSSL